MGISVMVGPQQALFLVLDTGSPASALNPTIGQDLHARGQLGRTQTPRAFLLGQITADEAAGQPALPDLTVGILPRLARLEIDGLLGLDFFRQFDRVCFHLATLRLELTY